MSGNYTKPNDLTDPSFVIPARREAWVIPALREAGTDATLVFPQVLSQKTQAEINQFCAGVARTSDPNTNDALALFSEAWGKVSAATKKELGNLGIDMAKKLVSPPLPSPHGPQPSVQSLSSLTKGKGERVSIKMPFKFSNHADVHLLLNYDKKQLLDGQFDGVAFKGVGIGAKMPLDLGPKFHNANFRGEVFIDTSKSKVSAGGGCYDQA